MLTHTLRHYAMTAITALAALGLASCSFVNEGEDLVGCPTGDFVVEFVYDYNIQRADMFRDHVGEIALFVFGEDGNLVTKRVCNDANAIQDRNNRFQMIFKASDQADEGVELFAGQKYRFVAVASQKPGAIVPSEGDIPATIGNTTDQARYRRTHLDKVNHEEDLYIGLDRYKDPIDLEHHPVSSAAPLDTLWHTFCALPFGTYRTDVNNMRIDPLVTIREDIMDYDKPGNRYHPGDTLTLSLIRDTKHLHVSLHELDNPGDVNADDYEVYITDNNGLMDCHNNILNDQPLIYRPYFSRTTDMTDAGVAGNTAHWDMMFNRIIYHNYDQVDKDARLVIYNKVTEKTVADLSLPRILAYDGTAYDYYHYGRQEYLDREYNYTLNFFVRGDQWERVDLVSMDINIMAWSIRRSVAIL